MTLLLDTHAFLWFVAGDKRLGARARRALERDDARPMLSVASVWEMAIKSSLGRLELPEPLEHYLARKLSTNLQLLPFEIGHALAVERVMRPNRPGQPGPVAGRNCSDDRVAD